MQTKGNVLLTAKRTVVYPYHIVLNLEAMMPSGLKFPSSGDQQLCLTGRHNATQSPASKKSLLQRHNVRERERGIGREGRGGERREEGRDIERERERGEREREGGEMREEGRYRERYREGERGIGREGRGREERGRER